MAGFHPACRWERVLPGRNVTVRRKSVQGRSGPRFVSPAVDTPPSLRLRPWRDSSSEISALQQLKRLLAPRFLDDETLRWFLRDRNLDVREAREKVQSTLEWRRSIGWSALTWQDVSSEARLGKAWLHDAPDVLGRPVVILRPACHVIGQFPLRASQRLCALVAEEALQKMTQGCETALVVFDMRGFGPLNADLMLARFLVDLFFVYYPRRLGHVAVVEAPVVFEPVWQVVKPWLKKYSALVRFVSLDQIRKEYFTVDNLPPIFR